MPSVWLDNPTTRQRIAQSFMKCAGIKSRLFNGGTFNDSRIHQYIAKPRTLACCRRSSGRLP
jgi:hypothetical protein